ncbi:unnamed protein product [Rotaria sp. Silwood2]|nr:unnamed protein product [Rotaria sp. Silwood2]
MCINPTLQLWYNQLREKLEKLNLFDTQISDPNGIHREILTTRLFLILLATSAIILTLYTYISVQISTGVVPSPTQVVYRSLEEKYPDTLKCPCEKISTPYKTFVQTVPLMHQVCSSPFVSQWWTEFTFETNNSRLWPMDVKTQLSSIWQLISALCQSATNTITHALNEFAELPLISLTLLSERLLKTKTQAALDLVQQKASSALIRPLTLINRIAQTNQFITALSTNYITFLWDQFELRKLAVSFIGINYIMKGSTNNCMCLYNESCPTAGSVFFYDPWETYGVFDLNIIIANETLPGLVFDCTPLQTILGSTLECFYNQSCLDILLMTYQNTINISILDKARPSRFTPALTIDILINELFIEQILNETNYNSYYSQCAPVYCSYTYSHRFDWIYVATTLIAFFGGLNIALRFITPYLIGFILFLKQKMYKQNKSNNNNARLSIQVHLKMLYQKVRLSIINFNLFDNHSRDSFEIKRGLIATRLFIFLFMITISVLITNTSISVQTITNTIQNPSQMQYQTFLERYSTTLKCPCNILSIPYKEFIQITPIYHQLCESNFIQSWWYNSLYAKGPDYIPDNFVFFAASYFRTLAMFCEIANFTIVDAIRRFSSIMFVNAQVISHNLFDSKTKDIIDTFINSTRAEFTNSLSLINEVVHANQYISGMLTNGAPDIVNVSSYATSIENPYSIVWFNQIGLTTNNQTCSCENRQVCCTVHGLWTRIRDQLISLNLFNKGSTENQTIRYERFSTRLYLLLLFTSILTLIIYTILSKEMIQPIILLPTQARYEELLSSHSNTLQCPCTHISVAYKDFITINTTLHQVCSSDFVDKKWIYFLYGNGFSGYQERSDLRIRGAAYFGFLAKLCKLSDTTIKYTINQFLETSFISSQIMPQSQFNIQMNATTSQFESNTLVQFSHVLQLTRDVIDKSTFVSTHLLNWHWPINSIDLYHTIPAEAIMLNNECSCGVRSDCSEYGGIYKSFSNIENFTMPGINVSCSVVETLMQSTFECLYNQTCIDEFQHYATTVPIVISNATNVTAMKSMFSSRFPPHIAIRDIVGALFIEKWQINFSYSALYQHCTPAYCSYTLVKYHSVLYFISRILGLYGGLTVTLKFIVPYLIRMYFTIKNRCRKNAVVSSA